MSEQELSEPTIVSDESGVTEPEFQPGEIAGEGKFTWQVILMLLVVVVTWATPNVVGRYLAVNSSLTPTHISALRYIPAALTLLIVVLATKKWKLFVEDIKIKHYHLVIASLILASFVLLQMYSVVHTTASTSSFLLNVNPVITFVLTILILKERHKWWGSIGVLLATVGIFFIAVPLSEISSIFYSSVILGNLLAFLSGFAWAAYSIYLKKFLKERDPITVTTWTLSISAIVLTIVMFSVDGWFSEVPHYFAILLTTFLGIVPTALAFTLWFVIIRKVSVQKASVYQFLIPIIASLLALALGEIPTWWFGLGAVLILAGLVITQKS
ncbi:MAG: DMT family transporter [Candidatus Heimdallarchaeota archaeon]